MRFMMLVKAREECESGVPPSPALMEAIGRMAEKAARAGQLVEMGGLLPSAKGARIRAGGGKVVVVDGPFAEAKELVGGYAVFEVASREEALRLGQEFMQAHADVLGPSYEGELEVRQIAG